MPRKRILVVDDNSDMVASTVALLRVHGHEAEGRDNAQDIVACVRDFDPDAVVLDVAMPEKNGWDAAREIRQGIPGSRPLLIALTAERSAGANPIGAGEGFDYFLSKPCDVNVLLALVAQS